MRWIAVLPLIFLLTSCIYTEGTPIIEPQDVVVSPQVYQFQPWNRCNWPDVSYAAY